MTPPEPDDRPGQGEAEAAVGVSVGEENAVVAWARAIWGGLKDTAHEAVEEGRRGAREANEEWWRRYDAKTRYRREPPQRRRGR